jgi:hypothetical protein
MLILIVLIHFIFLQLEFNNKMNKDGMLFGMNEVGLVPWAYFYTTKSHLMPYGEITTMPFFDVSDCIPVHKISLTRLKFMISDPYGNTVDLHGGNISFSLLFISND